MRFNYFIGIILFPFLVNATIIKDSSSLKSSSSYHKFPFYFSAAYKLPVVNSKIVNSGHGLSLEFGINPGQYLSKNSMLAIFGGFSFQDKLWSTSFNKSFVNDYLLSFNKYDKFSQIDSSIIYTSYNLFSNKSGTSLTMPGCETKSFHNYSMYYGLLIRLPLKIFPYFKIYTGTTRSYFQGNGKLITNKQDFNIFELRRLMYGAEIIFAKTVLKNFNRKSKIGLGFYFENCNFYNASLYFYDGVVTRNIFFKSFATKSFLEKYKNEFVLGFKLNFIFS
jgi:hypothetical protein